MALTITQQDNTISLEGVLNTQNLKSFLCHFAYMQNTLNNITLNIDKVSELDEIALNELKELYKNAVINNMMFFVTGSGSEKIYEDFKYPNVA